MTYPRRALALATLAVPVLAAALAPPGPSLDDCGTPYQATHSRSLNYSSAHTVNCDEILQQDSGAGKKLDDVGDAVGPP